MKIFLIANSHIDPMWLWEWEDGCASAISTFRTAADFAEKYDALVFNHNEALLYQWVESYEPELFKRIQKLVKKGKWVVSGGWYLQPDCNIPSGESIIRQITVGSEYFRKKFDKCPETAMNLDSFGHSRGLVQILCDAGYKCYYVCRPRDEHHDMSLPDRFIWKGRDGSEIPVIRDPEGYGTGPEGSAGKIKRIVASGRQAENENVLVFWGIGDHGGGISKADYEELEKFINERQYDIVQSNFDEYAEAFLSENKKLPVIDKTLGNSMTGCYTSQIRLKKEHRFLEGLYYSVERAATSLYASGKADYPTEVLENALKDLLLIEFHDAVPGSSIRNVETSALRIASHAEEELIRLRMACFYKLAKGQKKAEHGVYPILVYNPHPYDITVPVSCEYTMAEQNWEPHWTEGEMTCNGKKVLCQWEQQSSGMMIDWQKRVTFLANLKAGEITRFDITEKKIPARKEKYAITEGDYFVFKNDYYSVKLSKLGGYIEELIVNGLNLCEKGHFGVFRSIKTSKDPWGTFEKEYPTEGVDFILASKQTVNNLIRSSFDNENVRVIEDGDVRTVTEVIYIYSMSRIVARYSFYKTKNYFDVNADVYWMESDELLKYVLPVTDGNVLGSTMFSEEEIPSDRKETAFQKYLRTDGTAPYAVINDGVYGCDFDGDYMRMSLLRAACYSSSKVYELPLTREDAYVDRIDNGLRSYSFRFVLGESSAAKIAKEAELFNMPPFALCFFPSGDGEKTDCLVKLTGDAVCSAVKKQEDGDGVVVRIYNPSDETTKGNVVYKNKTVAEYLLKAHTFGTFIIDLDGKNVVRTDLREKQNR